MSVDAGRTLRLLLAPGREPADRLGLTSSALRALARQDPPELARFAEALSGDERALVRLLRRLPPSRRAACSGATVATRAGCGDVPEGVLDVLPRAAREAEARRMAERGRRRGAGWSAVLEAVAYLPPAEAEAELWAATRSAEERERARGYRLLFRNAALAGAPSVVTDRLARCGRLRDEPESVREAALAAIAGIDPSLLTAQAAPHLERLTTDALHAPGHRPGSCSGLRTLARGLLRSAFGDDEGVRDAAGGELTAWALRTLERLPATSLWHGTVVPPPGREREGFEMLRPGLEASARQGTFTEVLLLASRLGRRAHAVRGLQDLLRQAIHEGDRDTADRAAWLWLSDLRVRDERLADLLASDVSCVTLPSVSRIVASRRTDLLDLVLGDTPPYGRFLPEGSHWLPPVGPASRRWLPRQQAAAARLLARVAAGVGVPYAVRARAVVWAAWLPGVGAELLSHHAGRGDTDALVALARTERPDEQLPLLLARVGWPHGVSVLLAVRRASRYVPPSRLPEALRPLLLDVSSAVETARTVAAVLPAEEAAALLNEAYRAFRKPATEAVCLALSTGLLDREAAWSTLEAAAAGWPEQRVALLRLRPPHVPERHRPRFARLIAALGDTDDPDVASYACAAMGEWSRWVTPEV